MVFTCVVVSSDGGTFAEKAEAQRPTNGHANGGEGGTCGLLSSNDSACPFALKLALISRLPKMGTIVQYAEPLGENSLGGNQARRPRTAGARSRAGGRCDGPRTQVTEHITPDGDPANLTNDPSSFQAKKSACTNASTRLCKAEKGVGMPRPPMHPMPV